MVLVTTLGVTFAMLALAARVAGVPLATAASRSTWLVLLASAGITVVVVEALTAGIGASTTAVLLAGMSVAVAAAYALRTRAAGLRAFPYVFWGLAAAFAVLGGAAVLVLSR